MIELDDDKILLPSVNDQAKIVASLRAKEIQQIIKDKCSQDTIDLPLSVNESDFSTSHLLEKNKGWQAPDHELVRAYFEQLKAHDPQYTEKGIADLLNVNDGRSIRRFKSGERPVPYDVWRKFLVATGRAPIDLPSIIGFFK